jgi:hypothetical protein
MGDQLHSLLLALILAVIAVGLSGCATHPPPEPTTPANSAIGVRLDVRAPASLFPFQAEKVLFVKLDDSEAASVMVENIIPSNYAESGYHYLLDAPPGRYAVIGVYETGERSAITIETVIPISDNVEMWFGLESTFYDVYTVYFSEALVRETESLVPPGSVVFLGDYRINTDAGLKGADAVQARLPGDARQGRQGRQSTQPISRARRVAAGRKRLGRGTRRLAAGRRRRYSVGGARQTQWQIGSMSERGGLLSLS